MWYVNGASTFSIQDDVAVEFRSHESKMPLASPLHRHKQQHFCCRGPTQRQTWRLELTCTYASSSFSSNSQLQFVPDFRGKGKKWGPSIWCWLRVFYVTSMRRWCYILYSIFCEPCQVPFISEKMACTKSCCLNRFSFYLHVEQE